MNFKIFKKSKNKIVKIILEILFILCLIFFIPGVTKAATYYVDTNGDDGHSGNISHPLLTIQAAVDKANCGDTILVNTGNYPNPTYDTKPAINEKNCTVATVLTLEANSANVVTNGFSLWNSDYITIEGFEITIPQNVTWDTYSAGAGVSILQSSHIQVLNNYIHNTLLGGVVLSSDTSYNTISGNVIAYAGTAGIVSNGDNNTIKNNDISHTIQHPLCKSAAITAKTSVPSEASGPDADGIKVEGTNQSVIGNYIHDIKATDDGNDCQVWSVSNNRYENYSLPHYDGIQLSQTGASNLTFEKNIIDLGNVYEGDVCQNYDTVPHTVPHAGEGCWSTSAGTGTAVWLDDCDEGCYSQGIYIGGGANTPNVVVKNNIVEAIQSINFEPVNGGSILNNTIISSSPIKSYGIEIQHASTNIQIKNNIIYGNVSSVADYHYLIVEGSSSGVTADNNLYYNIGGPTGSGYTTNGDINEDPSFTSYASRNLQLLSTSPAVDAGVDLLSLGITDDISGNVAGDIAGNTTRDFAGIQRPQNSTFDIGAYEYPRNYYIDFTLGNDSNNGSGENMPFKTLTKIAGLDIIPGDTIYLKKGETWHESLSLAVSGSAGKPIIFGAYGATGDKPLIDGQNLLVNPALAINGQSYLTIEDLAITNVHNPIVLYNTNNIILDNISSYNNSGSAGIALSGDQSGKCENNTIENSEVYNTAWVSAGEPGDGILVYGQYCQNNTITTNHSYSNDNEGIAIWMGSSNTVSQNTVNNNGHSGIRVGNLVQSNSTASGNIIENNISYANAQSIDDRYGIDLWMPGNNNIVRYNKVYNQRDTYNDSGVPADPANGSTKYGSGGIRFDGGYDHTSATGNKIYYNLIYGEFTGIDVFNFDNAAIYNNDVYNSGSVGVLITSNNPIKPTAAPQLKNNIIQNILSGVYLLFVSEVLNGVSDNNLYYQTAANGFSVNGSSVNFSDWKSLTGQDSNSIVADPQFVNPTSDFSLGSSSSAINNGVNVSLTQDYAGQTVSYGAGYDIGAYEYQGTPSILAPTFVSAVTNSAGTIVTVTFSKAMSSPSGKQAQFAVNNGSSNTVTAAALNADTTKIDLTLTTPIQHGQTVIVSYTAGTVTSSDTGILATFVNRSVTNNSTVYPAPTFVSASTNSAGTIVTVTFSKAMSSPSGKQAQFAVNNGSSNTVTAAALNADTTKIDLTLTTAITYGQVVTVGYTAGTVTSSDTGILATFVPQSVSNNVAAVISSPTITNISPSSGTTAGGTSTTIIGTGFASGATVAIGGALATNIIVVNSTTITAITPAGTAGVQNIVVTNSDTGTVTLSGGFTYVTPSNGGGGGGGGGGVITPITPINEPTCIGTPSLTATQIQSIIGLLQSFGADASTVTQVQTELMCPGTPVQASPTQQQTTSTTLIPSAYKFTRTLKFGMIGQDVKQLQIFLNNNGFLVQKLGLGSKGKETTYFGLGVKNALIRFQQVHSDIILKPVGLTKGTGIFNLRTMNYVNSFYKPSVLKK